MTRDEAISNPETMKTNPLAVTQRRRTEATQIGIEAIHRSGERLPSETYIPENVNELPE